MPAIVVMLAVIAIFVVAYRYYSAYLARRVYVLDPLYVTPAHRFNDGIDFVPTNRHIVFSHHFISVAGAAPIVGPAVAVYWGWGPALIWVVVGSVFAAGVHDFGALVISVRHRARSIGALAGEVISKRARGLFLLIIFFLLTLVNAVFSVVMANLFIANPASVLPVLVQIPLAIGVGQYIYRTRTAALVPSIIALVVLYATIPLGLLVPISLDPLASALGTDPRTLWIILIFLYAFAASRLPVWMLLQPRDYINQHQMLLALAVILVGMGVGLNRIVAPVVNDVPADSPSWFPLLFVTIACGAISGFHSLVASGTTAKQIDKETDARFVGYTSALGEGGLAVCSILACTAGIAATTADWNVLFSDFSTASGGATGNFVNGVANFAANLGIPLEVGVVFAAVVVISFAATTMDTGVRLQRYIVQEIAEVVRFRPLARSLTWSSMIAVVVPLTLALAPGDLAFGTLWQLFGTTNQLTAGLALAVIAVWVTKRRRNPVAVLIPLVFLLVMTSWALIINLIEFVRAGEWLLAPLDAIIFVLALWLIVEATLALRAAWAERDLPDTDTDTDTDAAEGLGDGTAPTATGGATETGSTRRVAGETDEP
ncbi:MULTISPECIES: carbon starvation protein A [Actinoalloteichus]|uniref:Carbon starvation protein, predicted membrane protein n=1 Tax=Actinoalloteichus fjordicus TaxID=1612552 RepID=A0AAC9LAS5_9PSEU|nr:MULTISPECIES: carbon starvation protein A [Actinoalloteichus]APU14172.1 carbon starvation protein, predicted membrane protein [Actinoalloteichus fjordicus]APU20118.1 carbon starvation protein, predicted membrane protein [Actinoalloteichus sp. GBA129-24]